MSFPLGIRSQDAGSHPPPGRPWQRGLLATWLGFGVNLGKALMVLSSYQIPSHLPPEGHLRGGSHGPIVLRTQPSDLPFPLLHTVVLGPERLQGLASREVQGLTAGAPVRSPLPGLF